MSLGLFIGGIVVLVIGIGIGTFAWWAGSTTGNAVYEGLDCANQSFTNNVSLAQKCSAAIGGMMIGAISGVVALLFIIVGLILAIVAGIKALVDKTKKLVKE